MFTFSGTLLEYLAIGVLSAVLIWNFSDPHCIFGLWVVRLFMLLGTAISLCCFTVFLLSIADDESVGGLLQLCSKFKNRLLYACTGLLGTAWNACEARRIECLCETCTRRPGL